MTDFNPMRRAIAEYLAQKKMNETRVVAEVRAYKPRTKSQKPPAPLLVPMVKRVKPRA